MPVDAEAVADAEVGDPVLVDGVLEAGDAGSKSSSTAIARPSVTRRAQRRPPAGEPARHDEAEEADGERQPEQRSSASRSPPPGSRGRGRRSRRPAAARRRGRSPTGRRGPRRRRRARRPTVAVDEPLDDDALEDVVGEAADRERRPVDQDVDQLVEVPLVEQEGVDAAGSRSIRRAVVPGLRDVDEVGERRCRRSRSRAPISRPSPLGARRRGGSRPAASPRRSARGSCRPRRSRRGSGGSRRTSARKPSTLIAIFIGRSPLGDVVLGAGEADVGVLGLAGRPG